MTTLKASKADVPSGLPANALMLGAYKFIFDGSPQGYTAWMKNPGYYDWGKYTAENSFNKAGYFNGLEGTLNMPCLISRKTSKSTTQPVRAWKCTPTVPPPLKPTWRLSKRLWRPPQRNGYSSYLHSWPDHGTPACRTPLWSL